MDKFTDMPELLMYGMMMVDLCTGLWLLTATAFELPDNPFMCWSYSWHVGCHDWR